MIRRAEDRQLFRDAVQSCGLRGARLADRRVARRARRASRCPAVVRPAFTLGGHGGGFADDLAALHRQVERGLSESPIGQVLVEESIRGWDEFELEVIRDRADNVVIVCSIENLDPMGVHTGDSVTVAPQMTLSDEAYQELRDAAAAVIRAVGVETGGSNIQFARHRETGELRVIEMNPRVSRSSALASKATGLPDREGRREARRRLHARRDPERPDEDDAGELRADARLRRRQVPALRVREVPRRRPDARDADEVGRRGDGHRPHVHRGVPEGVRLARARPGLADAVGDDRRPPRRAPPVVRRAARGREAGAPHGRHPAREAGGLGRRLDRRRLGHVGRRRAAHALRARDPARVPARRLLRRRGRGGLELLLLDLGRGGRGAAARRRSRAS